MESFQARDENISGLLARQLALFGSLGQDESRFLLPPGRISREQRGVGRVCSPPIRAHTPT